MATVLDSRDDLSIFSAALRAEALEWHLNTQAERTILVPSDAAFGLCSSELLAALTSDQADPVRAALLKHHIFTRRIDEGDIPSEGYLAPAGGQRIAVSRNADGEVVLGETRVRVTESIRCANGIIHVVDAVVLPETRSLLEVLEADGRFSVLLGLIRDADLGSLMEFDWEFTLIAPTDQAMREFREREPRRYASLSAQASLESFLKSAVLLGRQYPDEVIKLVAERPNRNGLDQTSFGGKPRRFTLTPDQALLVDGVAVDQTPLESAGGLIIPVNQVRWPE